MSYGKGTLQKAELMPFIEQVAGKDKGKVFELASDKLSIGRSDENDIIVPSQAISRCHALLLRGEGGWLIRDNKSKNGVLINGNPIEEGWLQSGDVVQVGDFVFRFTDPNQIPQFAAPQNPEFPEPLQNAGDEGNLGMVQVSIPKKPKVNKRVILYGGLAVVLAVIYALYSGDKNAGDTAPSTGAEKEAPKLTRDFDAAKEPHLDKHTNSKKIVGQDDPVLKRAEEEMAKLDWSNSGLRKAEFFFRRGQREYLSKNYHRSIIDFQTALSFYRGHFLAERYLKRAVYAAEIEAKKHFDLGVQYFESLQYQRAIFHFKEVLAMMSHRENEPIINEAKKYIDHCIKNLQAAELFP